MLRSIEAVAQLCNGTTNIHYIYTKGMMSNITGFVLGTCIYGVSILITQFST